MKQKLIGAAYSGLYGLVVAVGLASWLVTAEHGLVLVAGIVGAALVGGMIAYGLVRRSPQVTILSTTLVAWIIAALVLALTGALSGDPVRVLAYAWIGWAAGMVVELVGEFAGNRAYIGLMVLAVLGGAILAVADAWTVIPFTLAMLAGMAGMVSAALLALSLLAPYREELTAGRSAALAILVAAGWAGPLMAHIDHGDSLDLPISQWAPVLVGVGLGAVAVYGLLWRWINRLWLLPTIYTDFVRRRLDWLRRENRPDNTPRMDELYVTLTPAQREAWLNAALVPDARPWWLDVVRQTKSSLGADALDLLTRQIKSVEKHAHERDFAISLLHEIALKQLPPVWERCFDALVANAQQTAIAVCQQHLNDGELGTLSRWADRAGSLPSSLAQIATTTLSGAPIDQALRLLEKPNRTLRSLAASSIAATQDDTRCTALAAALVTVDPLPAHLITLAEYQTDAATRLITRSLGPDRLAQIAQWLTATHAPLQRATAAAFIASYNGGDPAWRGQIAATVTGNGQSSHLLPVLMQADHGVARSMLRDVLTADTAAPIAGWLHDNAVQALVAETLAESYTKGNRDWRTVLARAVISRESLPILMQADRSAARSMLRDVLTTESAAEITGWLHDEPIQLVVAQTLTESYSNGSRDWQRALAQAVISRESLPVLFQAHRAAARSMLRDVLTADTASMIAGWLQAGPVQAFVAETLAESYTRGDRDWQGTLARAITTRESLPVLLQADRAAARSMLRDVLTADTASEIAGWLQDDAVQAFVAETLAESYTRGDRDWQSTLARAVIPADFSPHRLNILAQRQPEIARRMLRDLLDNAGQIDPALVWLERSDSFALKAAAEALASSFHDGKATWRRKLASTIMPVTPVPSPAATVMLRAAPAAAVEMIGVVLTTKTLPVVLHWLEHQEVPWPRVAASILAEGAAQKAGWAETLARHLPDGDLEARLHVLIRHERALAQDLLTAITGPDTLNTLLEWLNHDDDDLRQVVTGALARAYAAGPESWQQTIERGLVERYDMPLDLARQIASDGLDLQATWLYPFKLRPAVTLDDSFHLAEMVAEPDDLITASHITTWFYSGANHIKQVVVSGHANHAICKDVSAKIYNAILDLEPNELEEVLVVTGAGLIKVRNDKRKPEPHRPNRRCSRRRETQIKSPLVDLKDELETVQNSTGFVQVKPVTQATYDATLTQLRDRISAGLRSGQPVLLHHNAQADSQAVLVPFYRLNDPGLPPLHIDLPLAAFGEALPHLRQEHDAEMREEMVADARRRRAVFEMWLKEDEAQLDHLIQQFLEIVAPTGLFGNRQSLISEIKQALLQEETFAPPVVNTLGFTQNLPPGQHAMNTVLSLLSRYSLNRALGLPPGMVEQLNEKKYPISGRRNYPDATVDRGKDVEYVSLFYLMFFNGPDILCSDLEWIEHMDKILRKFDTADPNYAGHILERMSLSVFLDSFLRGWPSLFLAKDRLRTQYDDWLATQREPVWRQIHAKLKDQGIRMDPLQANSVVFAIELTAANSVRITPHYLTTLGAFSAFISRRVGIPYYINAWQHRERILTLPGDSVLSNRQRALQACEAGDAALQAGDCDTALDQFKAALRTHMTIAAEWIFLRFWETTSRSTQTRLNDLIALVEAVHEFSHDADGALPRLRAFNDRYPLFLAEPYLLIAYHEHAARTDLPRLQQAMSRLIDQQKALINEMVDDEVLIYSEEHKNYVFNIQNGEAESFMKVKWLETQLQMPIEQRVENRRAAMAEQGIPVFTFGQYGSQIHDAVSDERLQGELAVERMRYPRNRLIRNDQIKDEIDALRRQLKNIGETLWQQLEQHPNQPLREAMTIDRDYVTKVLQARDHLPFHSAAYQRHAGPLGVVPLAREHFRLAEEMVESIYVARLPQTIDEIDDTDQARMTIKRVAEHLTRIKASTSLEPVEMERMGGLIKHLIEITLVDRMTRNRVQHIIDDLFSYHVSQAYRLYLVAAGVREITEVKKMATVLEQRMANYQRCVARLRGVPEAALENTLVQANFVLVDPQAGLPPAAAVALDAQARTITIVPPHGDPQPVISFSQLTGREADYLRKEFARPGDEYVNRLKKMSLKPAYAILLMPITPPPVLHDWQTVLTELEPWLIRVMAYAGVQPDSIDERDRDKALEAFDDKPVVEQVIVEPERIREQFLRAFGLSDAQQEFSLGGGGLG